MKLLQESPVEFLDPLSRPPETVYISQVKGTFGSAVIAGTSAGILLLKLDIPLSHFAGQIISEWGADVTCDDGPFDSIRENMQEYLNGNALPIKAIVQPVKLTPFILDVHRYLSRIPFGETCKYGEIAFEMGKPKAARAVGSACGRNSVLIVVPCHRVLASNGLGGFGAGLDLKKSLLIHEKYYIIKEPLKLPRRTKESKVYGSLQG